MEWLPWVVLVAGIVALGALAPRLYRRERSRQRERGTIPGGFGVVDEAWRPSERDARLEREGAPTLDEPDDARTQGPHARGRTEPPAPGDPARSSGDDRAER